jgi:hypothetical protein
MDKLAEFGLKIELANDALRDLLWESYVLLNGFFNMTPFVKLYENTHGVSWGKLSIPQIIAVPQPQQQNDLQH